MVFQIRAVPDDEHALQERGERVNDLGCGHQGTGVVGDIDAKSGVHHFVRVICSRVFGHRTLVTEFGGIANGCFNARVRDESDDDELMDIPQWLGVLTSVAVRRCG